MRFLLRFITRHGDIGEVGNFQHPEANPVSFVFFLQTVGKFIVAFIGHNGQYIQSRLILSLALLIYAKAQASPNFLPFFDGAFCFVQSADLEHIGIVPAFFQRRMRENKADFAVERQKFLLMSHYKVIGAVVCRRIAFGVFPLSRFILLSLVRRKIAVVGKLRLVLFIVETMEQIVILGAAYGVGIYFLEPTSIFSLDGLVFGIIFPVIRHSVNEKQGEDFDTFGVKHQFLVQMLLNGRPNLLPLHFVVGYRADGLADGQNIAAPGEIYGLSSFGAVDVLDDIALVHITPAGFFVEVVSLLYGDGLAPDFAIFVLHVHFYFGRDRHFLIAHRLQKQISVVMSIFDGKTFHFDTLHQLFGKTVHGVQTVEFIFYSYRCCRIANGAKRI